MSNLSATRASDNDNGTTNANDNNDDDNDRTPLLHKAASSTSRSVLTDWIASFFQDWFGWEILAALVALLSLGAVAAVLAAYDSSSLPDWPSVITINTVVSFFSTIGKLAVTAVIGASISQSKWLWYKLQPRPLQDIQMFDNASRGPWGSVALLYSVNISITVEGSADTAVARRRSQASVGALIIVLMLLFDPFLQQVVVYPDRLVAADEPATVARARQYGAHSYEGLPLPSVLDLSMKAAIYSGIFDVSEVADAETQHVCPTGNCTWDNFASLAVCSKCVNISSYIEKSCNDTGCYQLSLPGGPSISGFGGQINTSATRISSDLEHREASVLQFSSLFSKPIDSSEDASAWECALSYCINTYSTAVRGGNFEQHVKASWLNNSASYSQDSDLLYRPSASSINMTGDSLEFRVDNLVARAMNSFMTQTFSGSGGINSSRSGSAFSSDTIQALYGTQNFSTRVATLATSMSNSIRQQNDSDFGTFRGRAYQTETYVHVRWAWFSYPAILVLLTVAFLIGIMIENARSEIRVWSASNVALLFHGQGLPLDDGEGPDDAINEISQMTEKANAVNVRLVRAREEEWRLVEAG